MKKSIVKKISYLVLVIMFISTLQLESFTHLSIAVDNFDSSDEELLINEYEKPKVTYGPYRGIDESKKHAYEPFKEKEEEKEKIEEIKNNNYKKDTILLKLKESKGFSSQTLNNMLNSNGIVKVKPMFNLNSNTFRSQNLSDDLKDLSKWYKADLKEGTDVLEVIESLSDESMVLQAEPDYIANIADLGIPNESTDPDFDKEWYLEKAGIKDAWNYLDQQGLESGGNKDIVVAVIDTGVDYNHPDLVGNMWINTVEFNGKPNVDDDNNGYIDDIHGVSTVGNNFSGHSGDPMDDHGHGTHVAGIISATSNNDIGGVGVAYNTKIMAIKAGQSSGIFTYSDIAEAIYYAYDMGADVINMSFGGYGRSIAVEDALQDAFGKAVLIAAAGNDGYHNDPRKFINGVPGRPMYPAATPWVLGVMAQTPTPYSNGDNLAYFSNWDDKAENSYEYHVLAPGVDIFSTLPNEKYAQWDGTSMAAPVVSGIAALLRTKFDDKDSYSSRFIMGQLASTGDIIQGITYSNKLPPVKYHEANAYNALTKVPKPKLSYLEHYLFDTETVNENNDADGVVDAGETVDIGMVIRNHWGKGDNVKVTIDTKSSTGLDDPYATLLTETVDYGAVGTFNIDDNGFNYEDDMVISVNNPFTITVDKNTPNDHVIPINVTIEATNGLDENDNNNYTFKYKRAFNIIVRNGRELPNLITEDMTLTKDTYWIIPNATTIDEGVTVTIEPGTQIQFWSTEPEDPYADKTMAYLQVKGKLLANGTAEEPIEMFASALWPGFEVKVFSTKSLTQHDCVYQAYNGYAELNYVKLINPQIAVNKIDHSYLSQALIDRMYKRHLDEGEVKTTITYGPLVAANVIEKSIFYKLGTNPYYSNSIYSYNMLNIQGTIKGNLFDSCLFYMNEKYAEDNVYLKSYKLPEQQYGDRSYWVSKGKDFGFNIDYKNSFQGVFPVKNNEDGNTYLAVIPRINTQNAIDKMKLVEMYANFLGGHIVTINNEKENEFITSYINNYLRNRTLFESTYPDLEYGYFNDSYYIGLNDHDEEGTFRWISGEEVTYSNWANNQPDNKYWENTPANFVRINNNGTWEDWYYNEGNNFPFIIEIPGTSYVEGVTLNHDSLTLGAGGQSIKLIPDIYPANSENKNVTWTSSNPEVASIDENGLITPLTVGETTITITTEDGGFTDTCNVNVITIVPETGVTLDKENLIMAINSYRILNATIHPDDATNKMLTWESSETNIATVSETGEITAISEGTVTITVTTEEGYTDTCNVQVVVPVIGISLEENLIAIGLNDGNVQLNANVLPNNATIKDIKWQSSNTNILTVDENGIVSPVSKGTAIVTAKTIEGDYSETVTISVWDEVIDFDILNISANGDHENGQSMALNADGSVWTWGSNNNGQLGDGTTIDKDVTNKIDSLSNIKDISAGTYHSLALKEDGTVLAWGQGYNGQMGDGSSSTKYNPTNVLDLTNIKAISSGRYHNIALKDDGTVWTWGYNYQGQLGDGTNTNRNKPIQVENLINIIAISAGSSHSVALDVEGYVWTWGYNNSGQLGDGTNIDRKRPVKLEGIDNVKAISAGQDHTVVIKKDGSVYSWGNGGTNSSKIPKLITNITDVVKIDAGYGYTIALKANNTLWAWGRNDKGKLGDGTSEHKYSPIKIMDNVVDIAASHSHSIAKKSDGTLWAWGNNSKGQLGNLSKETSLVPVQVLFGLIPDNIDPTIAESFPNNNSSEVELDTEIVITFNEGIKSSTEFGYVRLKDNNGNIISLKSKKIDNNRLILKPLNNLEENTTFSVEVPSNSVKDMFNNIFNDNYVLTFTTKESLTSQAFSSQGLMEDGKFIWTQEDIDAKREEFINSGELSTIKNNAILNRWWDPNIETWMRFTASSNSDYKQYLSNNYWGITNEELINKAIIDFDDYQTMSDIIFKPILTEAPETAYPFVTSVYVKDSSGNIVTEVGAEEIEVNVTYNRDMDMNIHPKVTFGPDMPTTDYTVNAIEGGWKTPRHWVGKFNITPITGDGYQFFRVAGAVAADDPWLVTGNDSERFRFEIITSGAEAMNLQATGGEGKVTLMWTQDDFDLLAGYNLYRSESMDGSYTKINESIIPSDVNDYVDTNVTPGKTYYYKFTVAKLDFSSDENFSNESDFSNIALAAPFDTIAPEINHEPVLNASVGLPIQIYADVTDNVSVEKVELYFKNIDDNEYTVKQMNKSNDNRYSTTIEGSLVKAPGIDYYIVATDGISSVKFGRPELPNTIVINDGPTITSISPKEGPIDGGTKVIITGSNFKQGASVTFDGAVASNVIVESDTRITVITPAHFPATVDVTVVNPGSYADILLRGFTYINDKVEISIGNIEGNVGEIIEVPIKVSQASGLQGADIKLNYDSELFKVIDVSKGNLTSNFELSKNTETKGEILISMASLVAATGSGDLAIIEFEVLDTEKNTSTFDLEYVKLNSKAVESITNGTFKLTDTNYIQGNIYYYNGSRRVSNVNLKLEGNKTHKDVSNNNGTFNIRGITNGDYTLTSSKTDEIKDITAYDASLILRHAVGLETLNDNQKKAADVDNNGVIDSMDASYVLKHSVGLLDLPFPGQGKVWTFSPDKKDYLNLNSSKNNQNFTAILIGDVSGNWGGNTEISSQSVSKESISIGTVRVEPGKKVNVPVTYKSDNLLGTNITISYDESLVSNPQVKLADGISNMSMLVNDTESGKLIIGLFGTESLDGEGELFNINFDTTNNPGNEVIINIDEININERTAIQKELGKLIIAKKGDINLDNKVNKDDLNVLKDEYNSENKEVDLNSDNKVDIFDIVITSKGI